MTEMSNPHLLFDQIDDHQKPNYNKTTTSIICLQMQKSVATFFSSISLFFCKNNIFNLIILFTFASYMVIRQISFLLLICVLLSTVSKTLLLVHYRSNISYYSNVLCENKAKPKMNCNGKCHLKKELAGDDKKQSNPVNNSKSENSIVLFVESIAEKQIFSEEPIRFSKVTIKEIHTGFPASVFHPPSC